MIIDTHIHILDEGFWPAEWYDWVALKWAAQEEGRTPLQIRDRIERGLLDPDGSRMLAAMDEAEVDTAIILPMDWGPGFGDRVSIEAVNEHAVALATRWPERFIAFAGVDPRRPGAVKLVRRLLSNGQARGLKLYPPAGFDPADDRLTAIYELCIEHGAPVLFHTGETLAKLSVRYGNPLLLQDVHAAHPELVTFIGHAGARLWWAEALSAAVHSINSYLELSVWIWDDLNEDLERRFIKQLDEARAAIGIERLVFGSDHLSGPRVRGPAFLPDVVRWYRELPQRAAEFGYEFSAAEVDLILGGNAARILGMPLDVRVSARGDGALARAAEER